MKVADDKACGQAGNGWSDTLQRTDPVRTAQTGYDRYGPGASVQARRRDGRDASFMPSTSATGRKLPLDVAGMD